MLVLVRDGKTKGVTLDDHVGTGGLGDCFKLYFDPDGSGEPRYRLFYRYTPDEISAVALEAIAAGRRDNLDGCTRAIANLGCQVVGGPLYHSAWRMR